MVVVGGGGSGGRGGGGRGSWICFIACPFPPQDVSVLFHLGLWVDHVTITPSVNQTLRRHRGREQICRRRIHLVYCNPSTVPADPDADI